MICIPFLFNRSKESQRRKSQDEGICYTNGKCLNIKCSCLMFTAEGKWVWVCATEHIKSLKFVQQTQAVDKKRLKRPLSFYLWRSRMNQWMKSGKKHHSPHWETLRMMRCCTWDFTEVEKLYVCHKINFSCNINYHSKVWAQFLFVERNLYFKMIKRHCRKQFLIQINGVLLIFLIFKKSWK